MFVTVQRMVRQLDSRHAWLHHVIDRGQYPPAGSEHVNGSCRVTFTQRPVIAPTINNAAVPSRIGLSRLCLNSCLVPVLLSLNL